MLNKCNFLKKVPWFDLVNSQLLLLNLAHSRCSISVSPWLSPTPSGCPHSHSSTLVEFLPVPSHRLTCFLFTLPAEVFTNLLAKETLQDGAGDGQHHGRGGRVAQPHGQKGGGHHHP